MNSNFVTATHLMAYLTFAQRRQCLASSSEIARNIQHNAVVVRRLVQRLSTAGLVETQKGVNGGAALTRPAGQISLLEIFEAVKGEDFDLFALDTMEREGCSRIINSIQLTIQERLQRVSEAMQQELAAVSIEAVLDASLQRLPDCH
jgi:Rrf2 family protein